MKTSRIFSVQKFSLSRRDIRVALLLSLLGALLWLPVLLGLLFGFWPFGEDALGFFLPMREFSHQALGQGRLPLWNPYTFCGMPFIANSQVAFWYPSHWLLAFLPPHWALLVDVWLHSLLLALGGYVLARSLGCSRTSSFLVAVILLLASPVTARAYAGHLTWIAARAYTPWMLWATRGCLKNKSLVWWIRLTILTTLCLLAGHPPIFLLSFGFCVLFMGYWCAQNYWTHKIPTSQLAQNSIYTFSALCFAGLLGACAILPMRELAGLTVHGSKLSFAASAVLSGTWKTMMRLVAPEWFGGNSAGQWSQACCAHEESAYIGVLPLMLAVLALWIFWSIRRERFRVLALWWLLPFSILMALGSNGPLYRAMWELVPPLQMTRIPVRWLECLYIAGALLAGFVFRAVFEKATEEQTSSEYSQRNLKILHRGVIALLVFFGGVATFVILSNPNGEFWMSAVRSVARDEPLAKLRQYSESFRNAALFESLTVIILCGMVLVLLSRWQQAASPNNSKKSYLIRRLNKALVGFVALDLLLMGWRSAKPVSPQEMSSIQWPEKMTANYQQNERWSTSFYWLAINGAVPQNVRLANGYDPLGTKRFFKFASAAEEREMWEAVYQPSRRSALWDVAGVTHTVTRSSENSDGIDTTGWTRDLSTQKWEAWKHNAPWPLFYTTSQVVITPENQQLRMLKTLASKPIHDNWPVVTSIPLKTSANTKTSVTQQRQNFNEALFQTQSSGAAVLVRSEANFPGWRVWVNGEPAKISDANYLFQAVEIPSGHSQVHFVYDPQTVRFGVFISLCAGAFLMALIVSLKNREIKEKP